MFHFLTNNTTQTNRRIFKGYYNITHFRLKKEIQFSAVKFFSNEILIN